MAPIITSRKTFPYSFYVSLLLLSVMSLVTARASDELDAFWAKAVKAVETGDFDTYAVMYHPDAVLVYQPKQGKGTSKPITQALENWKAGFDATKAGEQTVQLSFRFAQRIHGDTTAHETGIFCYQCQTTSDNSSQKVFMHFESLLVKKPQHGWLWTMEYQKHDATQEEWDALEPPTSEENEAR